jgi:DNA-binding response OmpR family regulator
VAERILICDDDEDIAHAVRINLELEGYEVHEARDGFELIDEARRLQPALVLLDVVMPGIDGIEVCRELRSDPRTQDVGVILLTARTATRDEALGLLAGADDYMVKPFDPADLVARVRGVIEGADDPPAPAVTVLLVGDGLEADAVGAAVLRGLRDGGHGVVREVRCRPDEVEATLDRLDAGSIVVTVGAHRAAGSFREASGTAE